MSSAKSGERDVLKLGTRRSLLAWAQSGQVAREIERLNPGLRVELVGIDTMGDKIQDIPLQKVEGKEFFVAEIDQALRAGAVDLTVHSLKDLSLDRPDAFVLAAMPRRKNPRDVAIFGPGILDKLRSGAPVRVGSSSPRRIENLPAFLSEALPHLGPGGAKPQVEFVEIRGNVNTRLGRLHEADDSARFLDGVILAFAGLIRLWADPQARAEAEPLFREVRWMVLPLRECPAAAGQGALAIECRADDARVREAIARLDDAQTRRAVARERGLLAEWGGGCHQKFGATCVSSDEAGDLFYVRGRKPDGQFVDELRWQAPARPASALKPWDGSRFKLGAAAGPSEAAQLDLSGHAAFVAHSRALPPALVRQAQGARLWCSGTPSWFKLAQQGLWVEGCAEGLGFESIEAQLGEAVLGLPPLREWLVLTHEAAVPGWQGKVARAVGTYRLQESPEGVPDDVKRELAQARQIWWASGSQFDALGSQAQASAEHACGPGKTAQHLRKKGINPRVFPGVEEWKTWLSIN